MKDIRALQLALPSPSPRYVNLEGVFWYLPALASIVCRDSNDAEAHPGSAGNVAVHPRAQSVG